MSGADPLADIRLRFLERCRADLAVLRAAADGAPVRAEDDARNVIHRLSGAAGTFGYPAVSALAGDLDDVLHDGGTVSGEQVTQLADALEAIL